MSPHQRSEDQANPGKCRYSLPMRTKSRQIPTDQALEKGRLANPPIAKAPGYGGGRSMATSPSTSRTMSTSPSPSSPAMAPRNYPFLFPFPRISTQARANDFTPNIKPHPKTDRQPPPRQIHVLRNQERARNSPN